MDTHEPNTIHVVEIEAAINYWRALRPSPDGITLAPPLRALAEVCALMAVRRATQVTITGVTPEAMAAINEFRACSAAKL